MPDTNLVLFYATPFGCYWPILAVEGEAADAEMEDADDLGGPDIANFIGERDLPRVQTGFFVWEGTIKTEQVNNPLDPPEYQPVWRGSVRPATVADLTRLDVKLPKE
jgi:hypothetical protein